MKVSESSDFWPIEEPTRQEGAAPRTSYEEQASGDLFVHSLKNRRANGFVGKLDAAERRRLLEIRGQTLDRIENMVKTADTNQRYFASQVRSLSEIDDELGQPTAPSELRDLRTVYYNVLLEAHIGSLERELADLVSLQPPSFDSGLYETARRSGVTLTRPLQHRLRDVLETIDERHLRNGDLNRVKLPRLMKAVEDGELDMTLRASNYHVWQAIKAELLQHHPSPSIAEGADAAIAVMDCLLELFDFAEKHLQPEFHNRKWRRTIELDRAQVLASITRQFKPHQRSSS